MARTKLNNEIWLPIRGYEGLYEISNYGRIKALNYQNLGRVQILKPHARNNHYLKVRLRDEDGHGKYYRVHRLVALAFLGDCPPGKEQVSHKNSNPQDNRVENLEWDNAKGNMRNEITRFNLSIGHSNPSLETREKMSKSQKRRFKLEREQHTGRYAV